MVQAEKKATGAYVAPKISVDFPSFSELWAHKIAVVRSIFIGFFCGILPGIGATLAAFMGYNEAVRWVEGALGVWQGQIGRCDLFRNGKQPLRQAQR